MNPKIAPAKDPLFLFLLSLSAFLELSFSGIITLLISPDPKNAQIFGYSVQRLVLVGGTWLLAIIILVAGFLAFKNKFSLDSAWWVNKKWDLRQPIYAISFALILWGWVSLFCPASLFHRLMYIFERMRPVSIALGASLAQVWLFFLVTRGWPRFRAAIKKNSLPSLFFAVILVGLGIFIATTKFGLVANRIFTNVPGIPLSGLQFAFILLLTSLWIAFVPLLGGNHRFSGIVQKWLIPSLIFLAAFLAWGLTPMVSHVFSLAPKTPSHQPFPFSDARVHDMLGISILQGYGVFTRGFDKPLYDVYMAILHFFAGYNYTLMTWLQIIILAFIPVILFLLGKKFHSTALGIFLAVILIIRQMNAIILANKINSINPKLFMSEEITLLGVALFAYLVFLWFRDRKTWLAILCGGCIGAASFIRLNPFFLFPAAACLIVPQLWNLGKKTIIKHLAAYTLGFLVFVIPCIFSGIGPDGNLLLLDKIENVIDQRYESGDSSILKNMFTSHQGLGIVTINLKESATLQSDNLLDQPADNSGEDSFLQAAYNTPVMDKNEPDEIPYLFLYHLFHNFSSSLLSMPDSLVFEDLNQLSRRDYWAYEFKAEWDGKLPAIQTILVFLNLFLIAIGLGISWKQHRWAGMIPLSIFITYSIGNSAAMSSGGRYLVPIDWTLYFYYGLAIVMIFQFIFKILPGREHNPPTHQEPGTTRRISDRLALMFSLAAIICLASLIPIANFVVPVLSASTRNQANVEAVRESISRQENPDESVVYGIILYPYYEDGNLTFDLFTPRHTSSYLIAGNPELKATLMSGEKAFIAYYDDEDDNLEDTQPVSIYLLQNGEPVLIWRTQP